MADKATAEPDWVRCERCAALVYGKRYTRTLRVCPECGAHGRLTARQRLDLMLDSRLLQAARRGARRAARGAGPAGLHRHPPVRRTAARGPGGDRDGRGRRLRARNRRGAAGRGRRDGLPLPRRQPRSGGRYADHPGRPDESATARPPAAGDRLRRRPYAGGRPVADADGQDRPGARRARRGGRPRGVPGHRPHLRRRRRVLRHPRRRHHRRARRPDGLRRTARHPADHRPAAARGLPDRGVPPLARPHRRRRPACRAPSDTGPAAAAALRRGARAAG